MSEKTSGLRFRADGGQYRVLSDGRDIGGVYKRARHYNIAPRPFTHRFWANGDGGEYPTRSEAAQALLLKDRDDASGESGPTQDLTTTATRRQKMATKVAPTQLALLRAIEAGDVRCSARPVSGDWWYRDLRRVHTSTRGAVAVAGLARPATTTSPGASDRPVVLTDAGRQVLAAQTSST